MPGRESQRRRLRFPQVQADKLETPAARLLAQDRVVQVHAFSLAASSEVECRCLQWLSRSELDRVNRFRFDQDRRSYLIAHGYLRYLLGRYCGSDPGALEFHEDTGGKPGLIGPRGNPIPIRFSLTHSHGFGLVAVATGIEVGIDLEQVREDVNHMTLAERFFSPREWRTIKARVGEDQRIEFFRHWVGKEAILKARGTGLRLPLSDCELSFNGEDIAVVCWNDGIDAADSFWMARFLPLEEGWVGAVAAAGRDWQLRLSD